MAKTNLQDLTLPELRAKGQELRQELFNLKLQKATAQLEKTHQLRELRRQVARLETRISALQKQNQ